MDNFSTEIPALLNRCKKEAIRHNNAEITPAHLLLSLLDNTEGMPFRLLDSVVPDGAIMRLRSNLDQTLFDLSGPVPPSLQVSELTNRIVKLSVLEARQLGHPEVEPLHVLLALFHNQAVQNMDFIQPFKAAGIDYHGLYQSVARESAPGPVAGPDFVDDDDDDKPASSGSGSGQSSQGRSASRSSKTSGNDTPMLDKFGHDMTRAASEGRLDPVVGRDVEIERLAQVLSRRKKNNPEIGRAHV